MNLLSRPDGVPSLLITSQVMFGNEINLINYTDLKANECYWADIDKFMTIEAGHEIPQSSCFLEYEKQNKFIYNYFKKVL